MTKISKDFANIKIINKEMKENMSDITDHSSIEILSYNIIFDSQKWKSQFEFKSLMTEARSEKELKKEYDYFIESLQKEIKNL